MFAAIVFSAAIVLIIIISIYENERIEQKYIRETREYTQLCEVEVKTNSGYSNIFRFSYTGRTYNKTESFNFASSQARYWVKQVAQSGVMIKDKWFLPHQIQSITFINEESK